MYTDIFIRKEFYSALDLPSLLQNHLLGSRTACHLSTSLPDVYWKLVLLYPHPPELRERDRSALHWINSKLRLAHGPSTPSVTDREEPVISLSTSSTPLQFNSSLNPLVCTVDPGGRNLRLCVRGMSAQGLDPEQRRRAIQGACSLVMFVPAPQDITTPPQVWLAVPDVKTSAIFSLFLCRCTC